jgi:hypothetical protein
MASEVSIANSALRKIGVKGTITSLTDGTTAANFINDRYAEIRDELLRSHPWNFAIKRAALAQVAAAPTFEYDTAYQLPTGWLRTIAVYDNSACPGFTEYREEGDTILASRSQIWLLYVARITDPNMMTPDFRECIALSLAVEGAITLVNSLKMSDLMDRRLQAKIAKAKSTDSMNDGVKRLPVGSWVNRRFRVTPNITS